MSLTHGHFYLAAKAKAKLDPGLEALLDRHRNAYLLGALGPDILYWADYFRMGPNPESDLFVGCDPHTDKTGELILNMAHAYVMQRKQSGNSDEAILAFIFGWITHWTADIYIHSLVDKYGGAYTKNKTRHLQLELVETKYLHSRQTEINSWSLENNRALWDFFCEPLTKTYPSAKLRLAIFHDGFGNSVTGSIPPNQDKELFYRFIESGFRCIRAAWICGNEASANNSGSAEPGTGKMAEWPWAHVGGHIPSGATYAGLLEPLQFGSITAAADHVAFEATIFDTGLYGKFLADYDLFMDRAIERAATAILATSHVIEGLFLPVAPRIAPDSYDELRTPLTRLFTDNGQQVDILEPEQQLSRMDSDIMQGLDPKNIRDVVPRQTVFYSLEFCDPRGAPKVIQDKVPITLTGKNQIFGSETGKAAGRISLPRRADTMDTYSYKLKLALTDDAAFTQPRYAKVDFIDCGEGYGGGTLLFSSVYGQVIFEGLAHSRERNLEQATGTIRILCTSRTVSRDAFLNAHYKSLYGSELSYKEALAEGGPGTTMDDVAPIAMMPNLNKPKIRAYSVFLGELKMGIDVFEPPSHYDDIFNDAGSECGSDDAAAARVFLCAGTSNLAVTLDMKEITASAVAAHCQSKKGLTLPYDIDLIINYYLDHSLAQGEGSDFKTVFLRIDVSPKPIDTNITTVDAAQHRYRVVAGPLSSAMRFVKHPASPIQLLSDPEPCAADYISTIVIWDMQATKQVQGTELLVIGADGELGLIG